MKKEYDFSKAKRVDPSRVDTSSAKLMISLRLDPDLLEKLKEEAEALGIGYQTLIGNILKKHIEPRTESFEEKILKKILSRLQEAGIPVKSTEKKHKKKTA